MRVTEKFRSLLQNEWTSRKARNARYSLRAFARDLGIAKSSVHDVLLGKRGLSPRSMSSAADRLGLSPGERRDWIETGPAAPQILSESDFAAIQHWYYFAILSLARLEDSKSSPKWIAARLGIDSETARTAVQRLQRMELIEAKGGLLRRTATPLTAGTGAPSRSIRLYHSENLARAEEALMKVPVEQREFTSVTFTTNAAQVAKLAAEIRKFRGRLMEIAESAPAPDSVYTFAMQLFPQTQPNSRRGLDQ